MLSTSFGESLMPEVLDIGIDFVEIWLDKLFDNELIQEISIVKTATSIYKTGKSIQERNHIKKLCVFLDEFEKGILYEAKRKKYVEEFKFNKKHRNKELKYIIVIIDRYSGINKPRMLDKLYIAYFKTKINWLDFLVYSEVIDRFLLPDAQVLIENDKVVVDDITNAESVLRLEALGLMIEPVDDSIFLAMMDSAYCSMKRGSKNKRKFTRTHFGDVLAEILSN